MEKMNVLKKMYFFPYSKLCLDKASVAESKPPEEHEFYYFEIKPFYYFTCHCHHADKYDGDHLNVFYLLFMPQALGGMKFMKFATQISPLHNSLNIFCKNNLHTLSRQSIQHDKMKQSRSQLNYMVNRVCKIENFLAENNRFGVVTQAICGPAHGM